MKYDGQIIPAENSDELEKSRVQAAKLQQDLAETTEILQQEELNM